MTITITIMISTVETCQKKQLSINDSGWNDKLNNIIFPIKAFQVHPSKI